MALGREAAKDEAVARPMLPDAPVITTTLSAVERLGWVGFMPGYVAEWVT